MSPRSFRSACKARYAEEIERTAYNSLLGAQDGNGEDWWYYTFPNGRRVNTSEWKCCKSSGAMALEELGPAAVARDEAGDFVVNIYGPGSSALQLSRAGEVRLVQETRYPFHGDVILKVNLAQSAKFAFALRIPSWAQGTIVTVNGSTMSRSVIPDSYLRLERTWRTGDEIALHFPMPARLQRCTNASEQDSNLREGTKRIMQTVMRYDYVAITRGPLVYATDLIDGFKMEETIRLQEGPDDILEELAGTDVNQPVTVRLHPQGRAPIDFSPYFLTGGRKDGAWRLTWLQVGGE